MGAIVQMVLRTAGMIFAGWGISSFADKVLPDKVPYYPEGGVNETLNPKKLLWLVIFSVLAAVIMKFIGRKLNIKLLK